MSMLTSFSSPSESVDFYKNKYIEELEKRVALNEKLSAKDEAIAQLLLRISELEKKQNSQMPENSHSIQKVSSPRRASPPQRVSPPRNLSPKASLPLENLTKQAKITEFKEDDNSIQEPVKTDEVLEAFTELDGDQLVAWQEVIKETHPGSLGKMTNIAKLRLEAAFSEYLTEKLSSKKVDQCRVLNDKNKVVVALPSAMIEPFADWLDIQLEKGLLDKIPLAKWKEEQARLSGKPSPKRRESSGKSVTEKTSSNSSKRRSSSVKEPLSFPGWTPWTEFVLEKFPDLNLNLPHFALFVKSFVQGKNLQDRKLPVSQVSMKVNVIPNELKDEFLLKFTEKFKYIKSVEAAMSKSAYDGPRGEKREHENSDEPNRKMPKNSAKSSAVENSGVELYNRVLESLMPTYPEIPREIRLEFKNRSKDFLIEKLGGPEVFASECSIKYVLDGKSRATFGIPDRVKKEYKEWALRELRMKFNDAVPVQNWE